MSTRLKWIGVGAIAAAVAAPTGAVMAANSPLTAISNAAGTRTVTVTAANQLLAAESDPKNAVVVYGSPGIGEAENVYLVPAGKALVVKTGTLSALFGSSTGKGNIGIYVDAPSHSYAQNFTYFSASQGLDQSTQVDFGSQLVFPTGAEVGLVDTGISSTDIWLYGYLVPASAAPPPPAHTS